MLDLATGLAALDGRENTQNIRRGEDVHQQFLALLQQGKVSLPPFPAVAFRIREILRRTDFHQTELQKAIEADSALAAGVLRMANSAFYARGVPVESMRLAMTRIGASKLSALAMTSAMGQGVKTGPLHGLRQRMWGQGLCSALVCQGLAVPRHLNGDLSFTCGLLHDLGFLAAVSVIESLLRDGPALKSDEEWAAVAEEHHLKLGSMLAAHWDLPPLVREVMQLHHEENPGEGAGADMSRTVATADAVVRLMFAQPFVTPEMLTTLPGLSTPHERDTVARLIPTIPAVLAAFADVGSASATATRSRSAPTLPGVQLSSGSEVHPVTVVAQNDTSMIATMKARPTIGAVVTLVLPGSAPASMWAHVARAVKVDDVFRADLRPFALLPAQWTAWKAFVSAGS